MYGWTEYRKVEKILLTRKRRLQMHFTFHLEISHISLIEVPYSIRLSLLIALGLNYKCFSRGIQIPLLLVWKVIEIIYYSTFIPVLNPHRPLIWGYIFCIILLWLWFDLFTCILVQFKIVLIVTICSWMYSPKSN